ncbi:MAG: hypothetical protein ACODAA_03210 [Gemmatimonadota bacterium]
MKLATQVLMVAATAGLAVLALTTRKPSADDDPKETEAHRPAHAEVEAEAWFV